MSSLPGLSTGSMCDMGAFVFKNEARQGKAWRGPAGWGGARHGPAGRGQVRHGKARLGKE